MAVELSVVIPLYNEQDNVNPLVDRLLECSGSWDFEYEFIFINDGSRDETKERLMEKLSGLEKFRVHHSLRNAGKSRAYSLGFGLARGKLIATMDGDLQDDPSDLLKLKAALNEKVDFVAGWKSGGKNGALKSIYSKLFNWVVHKTSGLKIHDINCPMRVFKRQCIEDINLKGDFFRYIPLLVAWKGYSVMEVPVGNSERIHGASKYKANRYFQAFVDLITLLFLHRYSEKPMHFFGALGLLVFGTGFLIDAVLTLQGIFITGRIGHFALLLFGVFLMLFGAQILAFGFLSALINHKESSSNTSGRP